jgi:hypothetical protein
VIFKTETLLRVECVGSRVISRFEISKDKVNHRIKSLRYAQKVRPRGGDAD